MNLNARLMALTPTIVVAGVLAATATPAPAATLAPQHSASATNAAVTHGSAGHEAVTASQQQSVFRYWTRTRMQHAVAAGSSARAAAAPVAGATAAQWTGGGAVARAAGKVFFTLDGTDYVCSGAAVASPGSDVAITAGHCVSDGNGNWATNWIFVPGYANGSSPYGRYTARQFFAPSQWTSGAAQDDDVAFVALNAPQGAATKHGAGGWGLRIAFGSQPAREATFGYPAEPPYSGEQLYYCTGTTQPDPYGSTTDTGVSCSMNEGSSGGPWLSGFNPATGTGTITSVNSFAYDGSPVTFGPLLGSADRSLYQQAERG